LRPPLPNFVPFCQFLAFNSIKAIRILAFSLHKASRTRKFFGEVRMKSLIFSVAILAANAASATCIDMIAQERNRVQKTWNLGNADSYLITSVTPVVGQTQTMQMTYHHQLNDALSIFQEANAGMGANLVEVVQEAVGQTDETTLQAAAKVISELNNGGCRNTNDLPTRSDIRTVVKARVQVIPPVTNP
jgi:hypothetical protein